MNDLTQAELAQAAADALTVAFPADAERIEMVALPDLALAGLEVTMPNGETAAIVLSSNAHDPERAPWSCSIGVSEAYIAQSAFENMPRPPRPYCATQCTTPRNALGSVLGIGISGLTGFDLTPGALAFFACAIRRIQDADGRDAAAGVARSLTLAERRRQYNLITFADHIVTQAEHAKAMMAPMDDATAERIGLTVASATTWDWRAPGVLARCANRSFRLLRTAGSGPPWRWLTHTTISSIMTIGEEWWPDLRDAATFGAVFAAWQARPEHVYRQPCHILTWSAAHGLTNPEAIRKFGQWVDVEAKAETTRARVARAWQASNDTKKETP